MIGTKKTLTSSVSTYVPVSKDSQKEASSTNYIDAAMIQDSGSVASTLTFESISKLKKMLDENDTWIKQNDETLAKLLKVLDRF